jgi:hypothetical protein
MKQYIAFLFIAYICCLWLPGCDNYDDNMAMVPEDGIIFNPTTPYQEALPGAVISFKYRVKSSEPVISFGIRFKLPGSEEFVALPEYADVKDTATEFTHKFKTFEYSLPPSSVAIDTVVRFKFIAVTAHETYEKEYAVRLLSKGFKSIRLYSPVLESYTQFYALDLLKGCGVPALFPADTKDFMATTGQVIYPVDSTRYTVMKGWICANGTKFKEVTLANYNSLPSQYATIYNSIAAVNELTQVNGFTTIASAGVGLIAINKYYIVKVNRDNVYSYVGLTIKKIPSFVVGSAFSTLDLTSDYITFEFKN